MAYINIHQEPSFFDDFFDIRPIIMKRQVKNNNINPRTDVYQSSDGTLTLMMELPGIRNSDISIDVNEKDLVIIAERKEINILTLEKEKEREKSREKDEIKTEEKEIDVDEGQGKTEVQNMTPSKTEGGVSVETKRQEGYYIQKQILSGSFKKVFHLGSKHDTQNIKAKLSDGILKVVVPILKEEAPKIYHINIE